MKKKIASVSWQGDAEVHMDTKKDLEGLHIYMIEHGVRRFTDGTKEFIDQSISEHVDRKRAMQIRNEIDRRLFGGAPYDGMPSYLE